MTTPHLQTAQEPSITTIWKCPDLFPQPLRINLFSCPVVAGFPNPAEDYIEKTLDLNELLIDHPSSTFFVRTAGDSMINAGIHAGDVLIVDRSRTAQHGNIVIALINGEYTVKRLSIRNRRITLRPENPDYAPIRLADQDELIVWGVVTGLVRQF